MKALVLGSTGLVGNELVKLLLSDPAYDHVYTIGRSLPDFSHPKMTSFTVDLEHLEDLPETAADTLFIAFGTTIKTAGSKKRQELIDVEIPSRVMLLARQMGVNRCALVSALGVSEKSPFFYSRMKARLDRNARETGFDKLLLIKPSVLDGDRKEKRAGEKLAIAIGNFIGKSGLINAYRPVKAVNVAAAILDEMSRPGEGAVEIVSAEIPGRARHYFEGQGT